MMTEKAPPVQPPKPYSIVRGMPLVQVTMPPPPVKLPKSGPK